MPTEPELLALLSQRPPDLLPDSLRRQPRSQSPGVILQEYIPPGARRGLDRSPVRRGRFREPGAVYRPEDQVLAADHGVTACAYSVANPPLAEMARRFCDQIGFVGIADLDVPARPARRPVQAGRLQSAGRESVPAVRVRIRRGRGQGPAPGPDRPAIPPGRQVDGRRIIVEHADLPAKIAYRRLGKNVTKAGCRPARRTRPPSSPGWPRTIRCRLS